MAQLWVVDFGEDLNGVLCKRCGDKGTTGQDEIRSLVIMALEAERKDRPAHLKKGKK